MRIVLRGVAGAVALLVLAALAGILWPARKAPLPPSGQDRLLVNVRVVDVLSGTASEPVSVLVRNGFIEAIGAVEEASDLPRFDGRGGYLVPGFWDMHMHSYQLSPQLHFPLYLANGVTGVRDMMDCPQPSDSLIACIADKRRWTQEAAAGRMAAPRFVAVASFYFENPAMTPAEVTARATIYKARGLDALKAYNRLSPEAYARLGKEAARLQMRLVGHLPRTVALEEALAAGQTSFEHAHLFARHCFDGAAAWRAGSTPADDPVALIRQMVDRHDPALCARSFAAMAARGAWFVPTHVTREEDARAAEPGFIEEPRHRYLDPLSAWAYRDDLASTRAQFPGAEGEAALKAYFAHGLALTKAAHQAGVPVLVGTDTILGGFRYHDEMALLVEAGLTPAEVLRAATLDAARHAGMADEFGTVAAGKRADLVVLAGNPLADIGNTRRIRAVLLNGRLHDRAHLDALLSFARAEATRPANWIKTLWGFARSSVSAEL